MKYLKDSNPVEMENVSISRNIQHELKFAWWVLSVIKERIQILSKRKTKKRHNKLTKFSMNVPKNVKTVKVLDAENGNKLWRKTEEK